MLSATKQDSKSPSNNLNCGDEHDSDIDENADIYFEPLVNLPKIVVKTLEEDEDVIWRARAKLFRFDSICSEQYSRGPQWKERGLGDIKFLKHKTKGFIRLVMRREQTLTLCANHYVLPNMKLFPHKGCPKSWMWSTIADFSEAYARPEILAIKFKDNDTWKAFADEFENAKRLMEYRREIYTNCSSAKKDSDQPEKTANGDEKLSKEVAKLNIHDNNSGSSGDY
uniref:Ran-specific GTPase-activating protein n=1 Tax=Romanomermis culicivorax TaxID=13658 RepID=A0A915KVW6_ROMCU